MSQEPRKENNRPPRFGGRPPSGGDDPNQAPKKGPRFSIYWIYAIIFAVLIGFQFANPFSPNMAKISSLDFRNMISNGGEVDKYVVIDNRKTVKIYLSKAGRDKNADKLKKGINGKLSEDGPQMYFKITSGESFDKEMSVFYQKNPSVKEVQ